MYRANGVRLLIEEARAELRRAGLPDALSWGAEVLLGSVVYDCALGDPVGLPSSLRRNLQIEALGSAWLEAENLQDREILTAELHRLDQRAADEREQRALLSKKNTASARHDRADPLSKKIDLVLDDCGGSVSAKELERRLHALSNAPGNDWMKSALADPKFSLKDRLSRRKKKRGTKPA